MPIDLSILSTPIKQDKRTATQKFIYKDVSLDFSFGKVTKETELYRAQGSKNDLNELLDVDCIKNSLRNLLTTRKGQKLLNPEYGSSFEDYLFTNISELHAQLIGESINKDIAVYEPRVQVLQLNVIPDIDNNQYNIIIHMALPSLNNKVVSLNGNLTNTNFN